MLRMLSYEKVHVPFTQTLDVGLDGVIPHETDVRMVGHLVLEEVADYVYRRVERYPEPDVGIFGEEPLQ